MLCYKSSLLTLSKCVTDINIKHMPAFKRAYKKLNDQDKLKVNAAKLFFGVKNHVK